MTMVRGGEPPRLAAERAGAEAIGVPVVANTSFPPRGGLYTIAVGEPT
jgi:hypothetical protein